MNCCPRPPLSIFASSVAAWSLQPHSSKSACCASRGLIHVTRGAHVCCKHCAVAAQCSRVIAQQRGMRQHRHDWRLRGVRFNFLVSRTFHTVIICNIICNMLVRYVGAPMFAAAAAMSCGADLSHIYCSSAASPPIKSQVLLCVPPFTCPVDVAKHFTHCKTVTRNTPPSAAALM